MRYIKNSFIYIYKNFLYLFLLSLVPAVFVGTLLSPFKIIEFINIYPKTIITNFSDIFNSVFDISWLKCLFYLLAFLLVALFISVMLGMIENHFRSGKRNIKNIKSFINNNILTVLLNLVALYIAMFIITFLSATIIYLFHIIISGLNSTPNAWCIAISIIIVVLYFCLNLSIALFMFLNIPNMLINGYNFKNSLGGTFNLIGKNFLPLFLGMLVPYVIIIPLISLLTSNSLIMLINVIGTLLLLIYYPSFIMVSYFDLANLNRYDNRKYYNIK